MVQSVKFLIVTGLALFTAAAWADEAPQCLAYGRDLPVNNQQVLHWERTTKNQFRERAHISGTVLNPLPDRNGHNHFIVQIGKTPDDAIEVIYNTEFGALPDLQPGMTVEACGDYITSTEQAGPYPPSPVGAIIHWVHLNPSGKGHDAGFTMINGTLYGQDAEHAGGKDIDGPRQQWKKQKKHKGGNGKPSDMNNNESVDAKSYPQLDTTDLDALYETSLDAAHQR